VISATDGLERLRLLASAVAGLDVQVAATAPGEPAWTDGTTVYLDALADPSAQVSSLAVQASLIAAGSLAPEVLRQLRRHRHGARRYLAVEGHRALARNEAYLPWAVRSMIDHRVASSVESPDASLALALGRQTIGDPPSAFGTIRPRRALAAPDVDAGDLTSNHRHHGSVATLPTLEEEEADAATDDPRDVGQLLSSPVGGGGAVGRLLQRLFAQTRERGAGGAPGADAATRIGRARPGGGGVAVVRARPSAELDTGVEAGPRRLTYPEWNVHRNRYRPDWCTVIESDPPVDREPMPLGDGGALRRPLSRLGMGLVRCRRQPQGDDIDIDAAVEARVDAMADAAPSDALYVESLRRRRDLSVLVLLDVSGSAGEPGSMGRPVHEHQQLAVAQLTTALHDLGDRVALYAFNSQGRSSVQVMRVKGFDEGLDSRVGQRLGGLVPSAYTRLGAAIRHGASLVEEHGGTSRRLLVVVSDGFAYDHGYEGRYGEADARRALAETRRRGVGCLCLSVGAGVDAAALRRVFGTAAHASVPSVDQLSPIIGPLFRAALRSAEAQRRVFQRAERTRERLEIERSVT
jgi:hypothetical protein